MKTKGDIVSSAYTRLRISGLTVNPTPEENALALDRLETMCAELEGRNICLSYSFEDSPDPATLSGVQNQFNNMLESNLAIRLAPDFGKKLSENDSLMKLEKQAAQSMSNASARTARVNEVTQPNRRSRGSGNTFRWNRFNRFYRESAPPVISCDTITIPLDVVKTDTQDWAYQLAESEVIQSFAIDVSNGLELLSSSNTDKAVTYTVRSKLCGAQQVSITIVSDLTSPYNFDVREINYNVVDNSI
jgi:hypothetical protein